MLDEPMAGVNPALTQSLLGHVKDLREEGMTVLFVEHDMDMVRDISDWVIVMAQGKVIAEGPPDAVMADQRVIDAYLGSHHDAPLTERKRSSSCAEIGKRRGTSKPRSAAEPPARTCPLPTGAASTERGKRRDDRAGQGRATKDADRRCHVAGLRAGALLRADDLVAGYLPGVNILNGCDLYVQRGRAGRHHRPQRRRQVDAAQGAVRPGQGQQRHRHAARRGHHRPEGEPARRPGRGIRAADQQRLPLPHHRGEPADGRLPVPQAVQGAVRVRHRPSSPPSATGARSAPAPCPAASVRWWRWAGR